jgi:hypothetical protein
MAQELEALGNQADAELSSDIPCSCLRRCLTCLLIIKAKHAQQGIAMSAGIQEVLPII